MKVLDLMVDLIKMSKVWSLSMEFYGTWQEVAMRHRTPYIRTKHFIKPMVSLKMSILQIWVTLGFQDYLATRPGFCAANLLVESLRVQSFVAS